MTEFKPSKKKNKSMPSSIRKVSNSQYWSELSKTSKIMDDRVAVFVEQTNVRIVHPNETIKVKTSISTIITSKGKIIID